MLNDGVKLMVYPLNRVAKLVIVLKVIKSAVGNVVLNARWVAWRSRCAAMHDASA